MMKLQSRVNSFVNKRFTSRVFGCEFTISIFLGFGQCSMVFLCFNHAKRMQWAVKVIKLMEDLQAEERAVISRKMDVIMGIRHPNILRIHEYQFLACEGGNYLLILEEYSQFGSLDNYMQFTFKYQRDKPAFAMLQPVTALKLIVQVAAAVQYLHENNHVHGHISLNNILVVNYQSLIVKVSDVMFNTLQPFCVAHEYDIIQYQRNVQIQLQQCTHDAPAVFNPLLCTPSQRDMGGDMQQFYYIVRYLIMGRTGEDGAQPPLPIVFGRILDRLVGNGSARGLIQAVGLEELLQNVSL